MIILLFPLFIMGSCGIDVRNQVEEQIWLFEQENVPDKRETVFHAEAVYENGKVILSGETNDNRLKEQLLQRLSKWEVSDRISLLPDSTAGNKEFALVSLSVANLRAEPSHTSELVSQALLGTPVKVLKVHNGWNLVQTPDNYISWVDAAGIYRLTAEEFTRWKQSNRIIFTGYTDNIYDSENLKHPVADVSMGGILQVEQADGNFFRVMLPDRRKGYVRSDNWISFSNFLQTARPDTASVVELATKLTGRPYLWGGTSVVAMDCSGFTRMIYFMHGLILARDASLQAKYGQEPETGSSFSKLQAGDLLFFGRQDVENSREHISHVAISLGTTEYIHAAGRVKTNSFNPDSSGYSDFRRNTYIMARRIIGMEGREGIVWIKEHEWYQDTIIKKQTI